MSRFSPEDITKHLPECTSWAQLLRKLDLPLYGGNYRHLQSIVHKLELDYSHFNNKADPELPKQRKDRVPLEQLLSANPPYVLKSYNLKERLWSAGLKDKRCEECKRTTWQNKPIPLHLHHINGNPRDNTFENLQILCANCHGQTDNYAGKSLLQYHTKEERLAANRIQARESRARKAEKEGKTYKPRMKREPKYCPTCGKVISYTSSACWTCFSATQPTKIEWPSPEEVLRMTQETNFLQTGKALGVSDNAVRKYLRRNGLL